MKIGVNFSIDLNAIDDSRLIRHSNGKVYLNMSSFIDTDVQGQYGDNGMVTHAKTQDESKEVKQAILGNVKVFWKGESAPQPQQQAYGQNTQAPPQQGYGQYQGNQPPQQQSPQQNNPAPSQGGYNDYQDIKG